jgi:hypothetical protein
LDPFTKAIRQSSATTGERCDPARFSKSVDSREPEMVHPAEAFVLISNASPQAKKKKARKARILEIDELPYRSSATFLSNNGIRLSFS